MNDKGFTLVEMLIVFILISVLIVMSLMAASLVHRKARDAQRKMELAQMGRILLLKCYLPVAGLGDYDFFDLRGELSLEYPQYADYLVRMSGDPLSGDIQRSFYRYIVADNGEKCSLYANLEDDSDKVTLNSITVPTPGGGVGVLRAGADGWNGSPLYFQFSN